MSVLTETPTIEALLERMTQLEERLAQAENELQRQAQAENNVAIVLASNELDKVMPALIISVGAASMGMQARVFFTFWAIAALRKHKGYTGKNLTEKMMSFMLPGHAGDLALSKMNMYGAGVSMMTGLMKKHNVKSIPEMMNLALDLGVKLQCCQMSMGLMGITAEELIPGVNYCGVAAYLEQASRAHITMFI